MSPNTLTSAKRFLRNGVEHFFTIFYRKMLVRHTIDPLSKIISAPDDDTRDTLIVHWSERKFHESQYIQVAGGILFTSVVSALQWPTLATSHWSAAALFYSSILLALVAIVAGSQQMMLLPKDSVSQSTAKWMQQSLSVRGENRPRTMYVFALQAPLMLLTFSVMTFLAGLCSVVFSPLAQNPGWNDSAKTTVLFGVTGVLALAILYSTSVGMYKLFQA